MKKDYEKAAEIYKKTADLGNADAFISLGHLYVSGNGVKQDFEKASMCYQKASELGNSNTTQYLDDLKKRMK